MCDVCHRNLKQEGLAVARIARDDGSSSQARSQGGGNGGVHFIRLHLMFYRDIELRVFIYLFINCSSVYALPKRKHGHRTCLIKTVTIP